MLYFRDERWLLINGSSRFSAWMDPRTNSIADIQWDLTMNYTAGGARWRRVKPWERPSCWMHVSQIKPDLHHWHDLERLNFWSPDPHATDDFGDVLDWPGGWLEIQYHSHSGTDKAEQTLHFDNIWRVAARDGARFTVELVGCANGLNDLLSLVSPVLPDGTPADGGTPNPDFWKNHASIYVIEEVPFGVVTVQVSRNSRDPVAHAIGRAKSILGLGEPEHVNVSDYRGQKNMRLAMESELWVQLHYHGYYED